MRKNITTQRVPIPIYEYVLETDHGRISGYYSVDATGINASVNVLEGH